MRSEPARALVFFLFVFAKDTSPLMKGEIIMLTYLLIGLIVQMIITITRMLRGVVPLLDLEGFYEWRNIERKNSRL